jgi:serine protease Do
VLAVGVNGEAFITDDGEFSGIWVKSVQSGSPADKARIQGGDNISALEGQALATDGTMSEYCDTLRSHSLEDTLGVEVLRFATGQVLEGQLNGRELEEVDTFDVPEATPAASSSSGTTSPNIVGPGSDQNYVLVTDDSQIIQAEVPASWPEVRGNPWTDEEDNLVGVTISASGDLDSFHSSLGTPGLQMAVGQMTGNYDPARFLDNLDQTEFTAGCTSAKQRFPYNGHPAYTGQYDLYTNCSPTQDNIFFMVLVPKTAPDQNFLVFLIARDLSQADTDHLLQTFRLTGELP